MVEYSIDKIIAATGVNSPGEVLLCLPKEHIDRTRAYQAISHAPEGLRSLFLGQMLRYQAFDKNGQMTRSPYPAYVECSIRFKDADTKIRLYRESPDTLKDIKDSGSICVEAIKEHHAHYGPQLTKVSLSSVTGRVDPVYVGVPGQFSGESLGQAIVDALADSEMISKAVAVLESSHSVSGALRMVNMSAQQLLLALHRPLNIKSAIKALKIARRISVHEVKEAGRTSVPKLAQAPFNVDQALIRLVTAQPETLSPDQRRALNLIRVHANRGVARVLLNGDVGCGKTLVFLLASAAMAHASGRQVAIMAPSDLVAKQIHHQATLRFADLNPLLIAGGGNVASDALAQSKMLVGTQALLHLKDPLDLAALVIDEQHKFSVEQRQQLAGPMTHVIEATATPIPRTLALALFDGWVNATIEHAPVDKRITSHLIDESDRHLIIRMIRRHLDEKKRVIFLYPVVGSGLNSVVERGKALSDRFPGQVGLVHGKLKPAEKEDALSKFRSGQTPIIVASTAVEVGVDVPDVALMVVSGADRFGVAQLHQLRGRLARNGGEADFVMQIASSVKRATRDRLMAVKECLSGFELSERDLKLRGFGDVAGEMQSGKPLHTFKLVRLSVDDFLVTTKTVQRKIA